ncbi:MAG TPA: hypothetical protein VFQ07_15385 [Candidatus Polarisedimenticolia bacterium]|nr:hypothetical protein [Candidatus Polarisedimenticolia bacterium]
MKRRATILLIAALCGAVVVLTGAKKKPPAAPAVPAAPACAAPEAPRASVDLPPSAEGRVVEVEPGGDLQAALNAARPGDTLALPAGSVFRGPFDLPRASGNGWITVRSAAIDRLPPAGTRVTPEDAAAMPVLEATEGTVLRATAGAHHLRFVGLELRPASGSFLYALALLGSKETSAEETPHHIVFERCYLHGDPEKGTRRGIAMNGRHLAVVDSHLSDFKERGADSQAVAGWNGPGPLLIANNFLAAAGEDIMFGGQTPLIPGLVPADITIERNLLTKPLAWKQGEPDYDGSSWTVKNLFELKSARRVRASGNRLENSWAQAQRGYAVVFTVRDENGEAPQAAVEDVAFTGNVVVGAANGVNILGRDNSHPGGGGKTARILIANNVFDDIGGDRWGGKGTLFQVLQGASDVAIEHNTGLQTGGIVMAEGGPFPRFVLKNNVVRHNQFGIAGTGTGVGVPTLLAQFPGSVVTGNVIVGGVAGRYPPGNSFPRTLEEVGFVDAPAGNYALAPTSRVRGAASDGKAPGADDEVMRRACAVPRVERARAAAPEGGGR